MEGRGVFAFLTPGGIHTGGVDRNALEEVRGSTEWCWKQGDEDKEFDLWKKPMLNRNIFTSKVSGSQMAVFKDLDYNFGIK